VLWGRVGTGRNFVVTGTNFRMRGGDGSKMFPVSLYKMHTWLGLALGYNQH